MKCCQKSCEMSVFAKYPVSKVRTQNPLETRIQSLHHVSLYDEILFSIRFNTTLSTIEMEKISVLVTSLKTITQAIIVTQETLPSFISKKKKKSALHRQRFSKHPLFTTFSAIFISEWGL